MELNMISEFIENDLFKKDDVIMIENIVCRMKNKEETEAVKSSIQHLLAIIQKNYDVDSR